MEELLAEAIDRFHPALLTMAWGEFTCRQDDLSDPEDSPELWPAFVDWLAFTWRPDPDEFTPFAFSLAGLPDVAESRPHSRVNSQ